MKKIEIVQRILADQSKMPHKLTGEAFAPTNIALCKYWGKRNTELNLPITSSLSISLGEKGATTKIKEIDADQDQIILNEKPIGADSPFSQRLITFLNLFRPTPSVRYQVITQTNIPIAAGLASSACGFAAVVLALDNLYQWQLDPSMLSILARLGSGSAARSLWHGFVEWHAGMAEDGMDSYGAILPTQWPELRIGLHLLSTQQKPVSSSEGMQRTVKTSRLYSAWPVQSQVDMETLKQALTIHDFESLGRVAEANALAMHATMMSAWPPIIYSLPETIAAMNKIWQLRTEGISVYFTQDAGPNLKLIFLKKTQNEICAAFPNLEICSPFRQV